MGKMQRYSFIHVGLGLFLEGYNSSGNLNWINKATEDSEELEYAILSVRYPFGSYPKIIKKNENQWIHLSNQLRIRTNSNGFIHFNHILEPNFIMKPTLLSLEPTYFYILLGFC